MDGWEVGREEIFHSVALLYFGNFEPRANNLIKNKIFN